MFISDYQSYRLNYNLCNHHEKIIALNYEIRMVIK
jgi:hypothetical protein